jgi:hypothetical protein
MSEAKIPTNEAFINDLTAEKVLTILKESKDPKILKIKDNLTAEKAQEVAKIVGIIIRESINKFIESEVVYKVLKVISLHFNLNHSLEKLTDVANKGGNRDSFTNNLNNYAAAQ